MFKKIIITAFIFWCLLLVNLAKAQMNNVHYMIKVEPLYLINNGLCIDIEKRVSDKKWFMLTPQFYVNYKGGTRDYFRDFNFLPAEKKYYNDTRVYHDYLKFIGTGLDFSVKHFIFSDRHFKRMYFGYGVSWQYYNLTLAKMDWQSYPEGDLNVLLPETKNYHEQINKFGLNGIIGLQIRMLKGMYLDIYTGWGYRYSLHHSSEGPVYKFDSNMWDFGYSGIAFIGGVRVGVGF